MGGFAVAKAKFQVSEPATYSSHKLLLMIDNVQTQSPK